jgi:hypothetical protein
MKLHAIAAGRRLIVEWTPRGVPRFRLLAGEIALVEPLSLLAAALILGPVLCVFVLLRRLPLLSKQR